MSLTSNCDYVTDERTLRPSPFNIVTYERAREKVEEYLYHRLEAVIQESPDTPVVMLSGGIDSILVAGIMSKICPETLAFTFKQHTPEAEQEAHRAKQVSDYFGLRHEVYDPGNEEMLILLKDTVQRLETAEPWEILAGLVWRVSDKKTKELGYGGKLISGAGADGLFLGGKDIDAQSEKVVFEWDEAMRAGLKSQFTQKRFIPDFYERLLDDPSRYVLAWQTHEAVDLAQQIHPRVVRGDDLSVDKHLFRKIAVDWGVDESLVYASKSPLQVSSGGLDSVVRLARESLSRDFEGRTYSSPIDEPLEFVVARLFLGGLADR